MDTEKKFETGKSSTLPKKPGVTTKESRRRDWGYTDQYRRMMQRDSRKRTECKEEK